MSERNIADILIDDGLRGVMRDIPAEKYHRIARLSVSIIKPGLVGHDEVDPVVIRDTFEGTVDPPERAKQDSYDRGTYTELVLQQPENIAGKVAVWDGPRRDGKEWDQFCVEHSGKLIMRAKDVRELNSVCREFRRVPEVNKLLRPCDTQTQVFVKEGSVYCRGMLDAVTRKGEGLTTILDLKTIGAGDLDQVTVERQIRKFHYREQLGIYRRWFQETTNRDVEAVYLVFIALPPQRAGIRLEKVTTMALEWGERRILDAIKRVEECIQTDTWPMFFASDICDVAQWELGDLDMEGLSE